MAMTLFHSRLDKDEIFRPVAGFLCNGTSIGIDDCLVLMTSCCVQAQPLHSDSEVYGTGCLVEIEAVCGFHGQSDSAVGLNFPGDTGFVSF